MQSEYKMLLNPVADDSHETLVKAKKNLGFIPKMYRNMATAPGLLESYLYTYDQFRENADFTSIEQEVVFLTISRENGCSYCMSAHSLIADKMSNVPTEITDAIRGDLTISDSKLAALHAFTKAMHVSRGLPTQADVQAFLSAGYSERHILDIVMAIAVKTMSNFTNHLFHTEVDETFASRQWPD
ncbi:MAG TPA: carboxymuconolactone decarboxylase family protein [Methyloprofundus sp.]|uniref:carboxymuconolactone decarboxylase family protein n=1 Tax=Methyloprofundus sp. TaxID=2020875 RepID=UPI00184D2133|nr:carboxymuconolactone decarboxylase family protein [Methyloprofundus sp.]HIG66125.1 carboxymuconolactone decarboxylase family protein [Methyloprofundus sp.]HIL78614.1 carboxymuconolactone decarboxylase family protein [Methylococcales bacterium]